MDQKRLFLAIAISIAILLGFQFLLPKPPRPAPTAETTNGQVVAATAPKPSDTIGVTPSDAGAAPVPVPKNTPRIKINAPQVQGSVSLLGARIDELVLTRYHETIEPNSPLVQLLEPVGDPQPNYVQFGWSAADGTKVPDPNTTLWKASSNDALAPGKPVTLTWDNGAAVTFQIELSVDDNYMFSARQSVRNGGATPVQVKPWSRIRRDYTPMTSGYYILHEGLLGVIDGRLKEMKYTEAKSEGEKNKGLAFSNTSSNDWAGITDKYWLTALVPAATMPQLVSFIYGAAGNGQYQVAFEAANAVTVPPAGDESVVTHVFAGAKEVHLLDHYEDEFKILNFDKAVDFGWFYFLTKPFFYAIDFLNGVLHNFGLAIMALTLGIKLLFFPLANKSYRSMSKMKLLGPKMTALREQYKEDPPKLQSEMMRLYKTEKVNPASGCLPMIIQIPVFFSLYKVIFVTIEMRQAPFFGWIQDLSAVDPTNVFNLFGLIPFDPTTISPLLHLGAWPLIMGVTMFFQQKLNPPPPDPVQARIFQFMPIIFTFMLARFPAGLVIYWSWNNTLTIAQQWLIMRRTRLARPGLART
jgi:YidC/Oxa1 family membrane protein insertase